MPEPTCLAQKEDLRRYQAIFRNTLTVYSWDVARILLEVRHLVLDDAFQERSETKFGNDQDSHLAMLLAIRSSSPCLERLTPQKREV